MPPEHDSPKSRLQAGAASRKITPRVGCWLIGSEGPSTGVHDELYARVLVLDDGDTRCAIFGIDAVGFSLEFSDELRSLIRDRTGITTVLINCSHTHSAPFSMPWSVDGWENFCHDDRDWQEHLREVLPVLVESAASQCRPVSLHTGRAPGQAGMNRRVLTDDGVVMQANPNGNILPWVDVLDVRDGRNRSVALLYCHAAHPVIIHGASSLISADYTATAAEKLEEELGLDVVSIFLQGCGADINGHPLRGGITMAEETGTQLGVAALEAAATSASIEESTLHIESKTVSLKCQPLPSMKECEEAIEIFSAYWSRKGEQAMPWNDQDKLRRMDSLKHMIEAGTQPEVPFEITMIRIGEDWCLTAMPHEVFSAYALWIEEHSPFTQNMTLAYTNGCEIYVPTDADLGLGVRGGYEAACFPVPGAAALAYPNRLALNPGVEKQIKNALRDLWRRIL